MSQKRYIRDFEYLTADEVTVITTATTTTIFTGNGILIGPYIGVDDDDGTFYYTDNDGVPILGGVKTTAYAGWVNSPPRPKYLSNGLKVVSANFTGSLEIWWGKIYRP